MLCSTLQTSERGPRVFLGEKQSLHPQSRTSLFLFFFDPMCENGNVSFVIPWQHSQHSVVIVKADGQEVSNPVRTMGILETTPTEY